MQLLQRTDTPTAEAATMPQSPIVVQNQRRLHFGTARVHVQPWRIRQQFGDGGVPGMSLSESRVKSRARDVGDHDFNLGKSPHAMYSSLRATKGLVYRGVAIKS
jgi:hypothetical protein